MSVHPLSLAVCLALPGIANAAVPATASAAAPATASADPGQADVFAKTGADGIAQLNRITVTATRTERAIAEVPNTVDIIDRQRMDDTLTRNLKDLFRYEPGISVPTGYGRFGIGDIRIRGLGGNRVLIQTDGIPVSDAFSIGSFSNANRNFVDLDTLKRVEVVRGPGSSLYGSDALGGVVSFITKDPADYLQAGRPAYFGFKFGYQGDADGLFGGATAAFGGQRWSGLVAVGHRQGQALDNQGDNLSDGDTRTAPNPQHRDGRSLLSKLVYAPDADQRFKLTVEGNEDDTATDARSSLGFSNQTRATTTALTGDDHQTRARVSLAHEIDALDAGIADRLQWQVYRQDSETTQRTREDRTTLTGVRQRRDREFNFDQRLSGAEATLFKDLATGRVEHALTYGFEFTRTHTQQKRDGLLTLLATGQTSNIVSPDTFPVRDFPNSDSTTAAVFVQNEIAFGDGDVRLIPALRVDRYELDPRVDSLFAEDNPGVVSGGLKKTSVSPKLGAVWKFATDWALFGGYARGFRSPPYNDVNIGFTNLAFGYTAIANPDLQPETSDGFELGVRYIGAAAYASLSAYDNRYQDFIESLGLIGVNDQGLLVFQSRNVSEARIRGVELKAGVDFGRLSERFAGWSLRAAAAYARGDDQTADVPLTTIDPLRGSLGLAYDRDRWGVELAGTFAQRQDRLPLPPAESGQPQNRFYAPAGYGTLDLLAHWAFAPGAKVNLGVFNLGDKTYSDFADVPGVFDNLATLARYTRPGRNVSVSLAVEW
ncbi:MAG: TonB-dependent hemoglobin/transferrin/lactoferrin family receptor [Luteimonas sp.]